MKIAEVMTRGTRTCAPLDPLNEAARIMWDEDCGCVPVVDPETHRLVGMVTDRDVCMAAYTKGRTLQQIPVHEVMAQQVVSCQAEDPVPVAHATMRKHQVRRLPVVEEGRLVGLVSLSDLARNATDSESGAPLVDVAETFASVSQPRRLVGLERKPAKHSPPPVREVALAR
jgi:CBS domain-containing protein